MDENPQAPERFMFPKPLVSVFIVMFSIFSIVMVNEYVFHSTKPNTKTKDPEIVHNVNTAKEYSNSKISFEYNEVKSTVKPSLPDYVVKVEELSNLKNIETAEERSLTRLQLQSLGNKGFFIVPQAVEPTDPSDPIYRRGSSGRVDDMIDIYSRVGGNTDILERAPENAVFITTDLLLHTYHLLIDRTFQKIEEQKLQPTLKTLTGALFRDSLDKYNSEKDPATKESYKRLSVFYLVPLSILETGVLPEQDYFGDPEGESALEASRQADTELDTPQGILNSLKKYQTETPEEIYNLAMQEVTLVTDATGLSLSPLYGALKPDALEDYSQYKPRSHYTKNSVLRSYFRAMMWYGRHGFNLKSADLTRDAVLMTNQLQTVTVENNKALDMWEYIYQPSVFFVGKSDDLTVYDYTTIISEVYGGNTNYSDTAKLQTFREKAQALEGPKILSEALFFDPSKAPTKEELLNSTKGFRFMGQRFIPDSYIFSQMTQGMEKPDPDTGQRLPSTPTGLMVMSILGSKVADNLLTSWVSTNAPESDKVIAKYKNKLTSEFSKIDRQTWTQNIYWSWLYTYLPLFKIYGEGYPNFMQGDAWATKSLLSVFGSWTELRHDTLLYAKQSYAELGGGPDDEKEPPAVPKGYVEPNLDFLTRLIALNNMTYQGLSGAGLLEGSIGSKYEGFTKSLEFFKTIAEKELSDSVITDEEYEELRTIVEIDFPYIIWPSDGDIMTEKDARAGIIADVHTDVPNGTILYEATGVPSVIYVAVKDKGGARLTRGAVYSYYEFSGPLTSRMTDEEWQSMLYEGKNVENIPDTPSWTDELTHP